MRKDVLIILSMVMIVAFVNNSFAGNKNSADIETFVYDDQGKRDPFWPLVSANGSIITYNERDLSASDMQLTGIMTGSDNKNIAVINGKILKEGDMIGAFNITKIMPTFVVLDNGKEKNELHLRKEE